MRARGRAGQEQPKQQPRHSRQPHLHLRQPQSFPRLSRHSRERGNSEAPWSHPPAGEFSEGQKAQTKQREASARPPETPYGKNPNPPLLTKKCQKQNMGTDSLFQLTPLLLPTFNNNIQHTGFYIQSNIRERLKHQDRLASQQRRRSLSGSDPFNSNTPVNRR